MKLSKIMLIGMFVVALALSVNAADIGLTKDVSPPNPNIYRRGETIHYVMTVENLHGSETIEVDLVEDTLPDGTVVVLASGNPAFSLGPGGVQNFLLDFVVPNSAAGIIVNELRVVGRQLSTVPDEFDARVTKSSLVIESCLEVTKTADPIITKAGHDVIYTIEVCNCGENGDLVDLQLVSIIDTLLGDLTGAYSGVLPVGQCESNQFVRTVLAGDPDPLINEVTANYVDITGFQLTGVDTAQVDLVHPDFMVTKVCETDPVTGANAEFRVTVTNIGDVALNFTTDDAAIGPFGLPPGGVFTQVVSRPVEPGAEEVCNEIVVTATLPPDLNLDNEIRKTASDCCPVPPPGGQGCTPGFWKNNADKKGASAWCDTYDPDDDFSDTFGIPEQELRDKGKDVFSDPTLLEALNANGGGINALARHATAALLNACSDCVDYPLSEADIIAAVQDAIADGEDAIQALHIQLAEFNEAGCPVNQQGECSNGTDG